MKYDPQDTEKYRENTNNPQPTFYVSRTRWCVSCRKLRSYTQFNSDTSKICNHCKRRIQ